MVYCQYLVLVLIDMAGFNSDSTKYLLEALFFHIYFPYTNAIEATPTWWLFNPWCVPLQTHERHTIGLVSLSYITELINKDATNTY